MTAINPETGPETGHETSQEANRIRPRLLHGAKAIGEYMGLPPGGDGRYKSVNRIRDRGCAAIFEIPGRGLAARPEALDQWLAALEQSPGIPDGPANGDAP